MSGGNVRVRYAPSPTGMPHVGNIRTALFNWLFARHSGGSFIVRIEDTDVARKVEGAGEAILDGLRWLGMDWDEGPDVGGSYGPYLQSERLPAYREAAESLVAGGHAYRCYCSPERLAEMRAEMAKRKESMRSYDRRCRDLGPDEQARLEADGTTPVTRFKIPLEGETRFDDLIKGEVAFDNSTLDDFVILKSDGYPTYHLASIVDDHAMEISHVLRADEWLSSTPRHILLYAAMGYQPPQFAHLPMILGPDRSKLSKRHGATSITEYRDQGYLPKAMMNFLALLGWALDDHTEIFSKDDLIRHFAIERISKTAAIFDREKLDWMNGFYIRSMGPEEFAEGLAKSLQKGLPKQVPRPISRDYVDRMAPLVQERLTTFGEAAGYCEFFFLDELAHDTQLLMGKKLTREGAQAALEAASSRLQGTEFDAQSLEDMIRPLAAELGLKTGVLFGLLRVAATGRTAAPPLFQTMEVLGKERCLERIDRALDSLRGSP
jgi:glutamyl-tRNA synthetase